VGSFCDSFHSENLVPVVVLSDLGNFALVPPVLVSLSRTTRDLSKQPIRARKLLQSGKLRNYARIRFVSSPGTQLHTIVLSAIRLLAYGPSVVFLA
jgi:hypothetical protein